MSFPIEDEQFSSNNHVAKKRRTDDQFAVGIYDEDDVQELRSDDRVSQPDSRPSAGSVRASFSGLKDARSEFGRANDLTNAHRKKSRVGNSRVTNGDAPTLPISIDDDEEPNGGMTSRQTQIQAFKQGLSSASETPGSPRLSETTSNYFAPRMNHSTHSASEPKQKAQKSGYIRNQFQRAPLPEKKWPLTWARAHHCDEIDGDETDIFLRSTNEYNYSVIGTEPDDVRFQFSFDKVNKADSDHQLRIRLLGSRDNSGRQYLVDLAFANQEDLHVFLQELARSITAKSLVTKTKTYMETIFHKPLEMPPPSSSAVLSSSMPDEVRPASSHLKKTSLLQNLLGDEVAVIAPQHAQTSPESTTAQSRRRPLRATRQTQSVGITVDDSEDEPTIERYSVIHGLGPKWKKQLEYGSGRNRAVVDFADLPRLDDGEFLNDSLINFYLLYLKDQAKASGERVKIFATQFYDTLTRKVPGERSKINYQGVARWTRHEDIFGYDHIMVPINHDHHWYLAIICNVSSIARVPAIEDLTEGDDLSSRGSKGAPGNEEKAEQSSEARSPPTLVNKTPDSSVAVAQNAEEDSEASDLDVVDGHATGPESHQSVASKSPSAIESPAEETAQLKKLSLGDSKSSGMLLNKKAAMSSPKKTKRRPPPPRKYDPNQPVVIVLDSLGHGSKTAAVSLLKEYIFQEGQEKRGMDAKIHQNGFYAKDKHIPQQNNFYDCGVYLLGYAQKFLEDPNGFKNELLQGEMRADTDWPNMDVAKMRSDMRDILKSLYDEQEARHKEKKAAKGAKTEAVATPVEKDDAQIPTIAKTVKPVSVEESKDTARGTEEVPPMSEEHASAPVSEEKQSQLRLGSPFEPQAPSKRSRSRSVNLVAPIKVDRSPVSEARREGSSYVNSRQESPEVRVLRRKQSPIVLIGSPSQKSPKRPLKELTSDGADEKTVKRPRTATQQSPDRSIASPRRTTKSNSPTITVRSPGPKSSPLTHRRPKENPSSPSRNSTFHSKGSSLDPIPIDDSQDSVFPASSPVRRTSHYWDGDVDDEQPEVIITSPHPRSRSRPSTHMASYRRQEHFSSPARFPARRGSPYMADDVDVVEQRRALTYYAARRRRAGSEERAWEVPETPPPEGRGEVGE